METGKHAFYGSFRKRFFVYKNALCFRGLLDETCYLPYHILYSSGCASLLILLDESCFSATISGTSDLCKVDIFTVAGVYFFGRGISLQTWYFYQAAEFGCKPCGDDVQLAGNFQFPCAFLFDVLRDEDSVCEWNRYWPLYLVVASLLQALENILVSSTGSSTHFAKRSGWHTP